MLAAALRPSPMAKITVAAPRTMSPPAQTFVMLVACFSSTVMWPWSSTLISGVVAGINGLELFQRATITASQGISCSEPLISTGRRRPFSSGSPSS